MAQIIVNVDGLTTEEKQRVSEALAKIKNIGMCYPLYWDVVILLYGPSVDGLNVGFGYDAYEETTHTPQQVLEMAGMVGMTEMTTERKVRKDFDAAKSYSVDVSECTQDEKKEVQQAFFDAGFPWRLGGKEYRFLDANQYSNTMENGEVTEYCMYGSSTEECNMTAKEFLDLVYGSEQVGHVHAGLMAQYAEDAQTTDKPWELWQVKCDDGLWHRCQNHPKWRCTKEYRRKPKTHIVNGVEVPDLRVTPGYGEKYYLVDPLSRTFFTVHNFVDHGMEKIWIERGLIYPYTEEGKQAAILHTKAWLGMVKE